MIAKQSREGWFQSRIPAGFRFGTTPALRATPPDSGGELCFAEHFGQQRMAGAITQPGAQSVPRTSRTQSSRTLSRTDFPEVSLSVGRAPYFSRSVMISRCSSREAGDPLPPRPVF